MTRRINLQKRYKSLLCCILLGLFVMAYSCLRVGAGQVNHLTIDFTYGIAGITKIDASTPITISIANQGEEIKGKVQVILSYVAPTNSTIETVLLNGYKEKNYMFEKNVDIASNTTTDVSMVVPIMSQTSQLKILVYDEYDNVINTSKQTIESSDYYYYVYTGVLSKDTMIRNYFENTALYQYNDYSYKAILLNDTDIPSENYGLDLFNVIITTEEDLKSLTKEQRDVLYNWEKNGGYLVKLNSSSLASWENVIPENQLKKLDYSYRSNTNWSITYALSNVFMNHLPSFTIYVVILVIYILLIGPLLYIVLKKLNKRKQLWLFEIAGALIFMTIIIALGSETRLKAPFINYFRIVTYNDQKVDNSVYFDIRAPFNNQYKLYLDKNYSFKPIYDTYYYDNVDKLAKLDDYNVGITKNENENIVTIKNDVAFTKEYFYAEKSEDVSGQDFIRVDMNMFGDKVSGTITNNLEDSVENAAIVVYNKIIFLNSLPAKSTINLNNMKIYTYNPKFKYGLTNGIAGLKVEKNGYIKEGYMIQNQKKNILDFYLEKEFGVYTNHAYLIGFTKDSNQLDLQLDSSYDAYGMTMIEAPIHVNYTNKDYLYTTYVPIKNEEYSSSGDIMYTDEMILTYNLGSNLSDISLYFNDLSYYDEEYYKDFSGHIYFYNRNTTLYDPIDLSKKSISAEELKPYLNEENEIVIKYVEPFNKEEKQALLPSLSTIGRVDDVQN